MAYNNYNYSPYFQHETGQGQDGRAQQPYTDPRSGSFQPQSYPATNSSQTYPQQYTPLNHTSNVYTDQGYRDANAANNKRAESTREGYSHAHNSRASVDTTALGSVAYASSLGHDSREQATTARSNPSMQQIINYNRSQAGSPSNETGSVKMSTYDQQRSSSGGTNAGNHGVPRTQSYTVPQTSFPPTSGIPKANGDISRPSNGSFGQRSLSSSEAQPSYSNGNETKQLSRQYQQPSRPTSASHMRFNSQINQLSPISAGYSSNQSSKPNDQAQGDTYLPDQTSQPTSSSAYSTSMSAKQQSYEKQDFTNDRPSAMSTPTQSYGRQNIVKQSDKLEFNHTSSPRQPAMSSQAFAQSPTVHDSEHVQPTTSVEPQVPSTVDPSQVFNQFEYQRRQDVTAAEAAALTQNPNARVSAVINADSDFSKKDQMELEMKQMIEKMRDYKAKDPSLFSQIWEQVKKGTPPIRASSQPTVKEATLPKPSADSGASSAINMNDHLPSPSPIRNQLPLKSELEVIDSSSKPGFDRGKFPAQRRRRGASKAPSRQSAGHAQTSIEPPSDETAKNSNSVPSHSTASDTMQKAMESYHENLDPRLRSQTPSKAPPEIVYVSGIGPTDSAISVNTNAAVSKLANRDSRRKTPGFAPVANMTPSSNSAPADAESSMARINNVYPPSRGTIWPEAHKWKLAAAARTALTSAGANAEKELTADEIHQILNQNPSYTELCETLEAKGFIIDRGPFARILLAAVPDFESIQGQTRSVPALQTPSESATAPRSKSSAIRPPMFGMLVPPEASTTGSNGLLGEVQSAGPSPSCKNPNIRWADQVMSNLSHPNNLQPSQQLFTPLAAPASPKPSTKEEMARKRSFNDIVDLTQALSDEDDFQPSLKVRRIESPRIDDSTFTKSISASILPQFATSNHIKKPVSSLPPHETLKTRATDSKSGQSSSTNPRTYHDFSQYKYGPLPVPSQPPLLPPSKREHLRLTNVVRLMNRNDALRRSSYNPKTICRDILVSSGKHPTMAPLNYHLEILRKNFDSVDNNSDLSTFKWDVIDPGGHPEPSMMNHQCRDVDMHDADDEGVQSTISPRPDVTKPIKGSLSRRERRKRNSGTQSKPIDVDAPENHLGIDNPSLNKTKEFEDQDLSRQSAGAGASLDYVHIGSEGPENVISTGEVRSPRRDRPPGKRMFSTPVANTVSLSSPSDAGAGSEPKRRGRPPGSKDQSLRKNAAILKDTDMPIRTPPAPSTMNTTPFKPSALRQTMTPSDSIAVVIQSPSKPNNDERTRSKSSSGSRQPPDHQVYNCQWKGCQARLHNLETLRKHIRLHRKGHPFPCFWAGCGASKVSNGKQQGEHQPLEFGREAAWDSHMEERHLDPYASELGNGPSVHPSGNLHTLRSRDSLHTNNSNPDAEVSDSQDRPVPPFTFSAINVPPNPFHKPRSARAYHK